MGFIDKALQKSEIKLFNPLVTELSKVSSDVEVALADVTCAENSSFSHKGISIRWNTGAELYLHRCRNIWMSSANSLGLNAVPFAMQFVSIPEASIYLTMLISPVDERQGDTLDKPSIAERDEHHEGEQVEASKSEVEQAAEAIAEIVDSLQDLMVRSGSPSEHAQQKAEELAQEWLSGIEAELKDEPDELIGSLWLERKQPGTEHGRRTIAEIDSRLEFLKINKVEDAQIVDWWNRPAANRHLCKAQNLGLLDSRTLVRYDQISDRLDNRSQMAFLQAICTVPFFSYGADINLDLNMPLTPLPWEQFETAMAFLLEQMNTNPRWEVEAIEARSFNRYFRLKALGFK